METTARPARQNDEFYRPPAMNEHLARKIAADPAEFSAAERADALAYWTARSASAPTGAAGWEADRLANKIRTAR